MTLNIIVSDNLVSGPTMIRDRQEHTLIHHAIAYLGRRRAFDPAQQLATTVAQRQRNICRGVSLVCLSDY